MFTDELKKLKDEQLLAGIKKLRGYERKLDRRVIEYICEIESRRLHNQLGFPSIIEWLIKDLGYTESSAYRRAMAARALRASPAFTEKLETGELNLVNLAKLQSALQAEEGRTRSRTVKEKRLKLLERLSGKTIRETERILAQEFPLTQKLVQETVNLSEETMQKLKRIREIKSHTLGSANLSELIAQLADEYLEKNDPLLKMAKTQSSTTVKLTKTPAGPATNRKSIAPSAVIFVRKRAGDACEFVSETGRRCSSRYFTEIDHKIPVALGGTNELSNLQVLCRAHNLLLAGRVFGSEKIEQFRASE